LPKDDNIKIDVFNSLGQKVKTVFNGKQSAGKNIQVTWNGTDAKNKPVASGIYFYRISSSNKSISRKMLLVK